MNLREMAALSIVSVSDLAKKFSNNNLQISLS